MDKPRLLIVVNDAGFFLSHRLPIAQAARSQGFEVHIATMAGAATEKIERLGFEHHELPLTRSGRKPIKELVSLIAMWRLFRSLRPELIHLVTIKPVLYGGIAARLCRVPAIVSAISGLGFLFVERTNWRLRMFRYVVLLLYRFAMTHPNQCVIFQNSTDRIALESALAMPKCKSVLIRGSGVDLQQYSMLPETDGVPIVAMASRLLKDKGVYEFVEAARILKSREIEVRFWLVGAPDPGNPESVNDNEVRAWRDEGLVECLGFRNDIAKLFAKAHIVTLPSFYGEGLPRVLIEAAACGRAVVTTDMPGCRDAIEPDISGKLIPIRDSKALADALQALITDGEARQRMGKAGRALAERAFSIDQVVQAHMQIYQDLSGNT